MLSLLALSPQHSTTQFKLIWLLLVLLWLEYTSIWLHYVCICVLSVVVVVFDGPRHQRHTLIIITIINLWKQFHNNKFINECFTIQFDVVVAFVVFVKFFSLRDKKYTEIEAISQHCTHFFLSLSMELIKFVFTFCLFFCCIIVQIGKIDFFMHLLIWMVFHIYL